MSLIPLSRLMRPQRRVALQAKINIMAPPSSPSYILPQADGFWPAGSVGSWMAELEGIKSPSRKLCCADGWMDKKFFRYVKGWLNFTLFLVLSWRKFSVLLS